MERMLLKCSYGQFFAFCNVIFVFIDNLGSKMGKAEKKPLKVKNIYKILFCRPILYSQNKQQVSPDMCVNKKPDC